MFSPSELNEVLGGGNFCDIDVNDLKKHTIYNGKTSIIIIIYDTKNLTLCNPKFHLNNWVIEGTLFDVYIFLYVLQLRSTVKFMAKSYTILYL